MADQVRTIKVSVDVPSSSGLKELASQFGQLNKSAKTSADVLTSFQNTLRTIGGISIAGFGLRELAGIADSMQLLTDRIKVFTGDGDKANAVVEKLAKVANYTKSSIADLGGVYNRFAVATQGLGLSSDAVLSTVELLQQTFRLSGATQEEAAGSTIQLSQAFSLGALRGQELRSVMLGNATLAGILRKEIEKLGGSTEEWGRKGLITPAFLLKVLSKNFDEVNAKAAQLSPTFGQTLTTAMNDFTVALGKLNKELDLSGKFAKGIEGLKNNISVIAGIFAGLGIPALLAFIGKATAAILTFVAALNPYVLAIGLISAGIAIIATDLERYKLRLEQIGEGLKFVADTIVAKLGRIAAFFGKNLGIEALENFGKGLDENFTKKSAEAAKNFQHLQFVVQGGIASPADLKRLEDQSDAIKNFIPSNLKDKVKAKSYAEQLKEIEQSFGDLEVKFNKGKIGVQDYNYGLDSLTEKLLKLKLGFGKISLSKFSDEYQKLERTKLTNLFDAGAISVERFIEETKKLDLSEVETKFAKGKITALEYHEAVLKLADDFRPGSTLYVGIEGYIQSSGTLAQNVARGITNTFNTLENSLMDFIKTGTFEFKKFAQSILDDINRIIIRAAIVQPLANALLKALPATGYSPGAFDENTGSSGFADANGRRALGAAYVNGLEMYANGGIFDKPTMFQHSRGLGVLGEAGPEGILPLRRNSKGQLGVVSNGGGSGSNVEINIINQASGTEVQQTETTNSSGDKVIDVLIISKVKEGFANGSFDKQMNAQYGLRRRGT